MQSQPFVERLFLSFSARIARTVLILGTAITAPVTIIERGTVCYQGDEGTWWVITGEITEYGSFYCHY